MEDSGNHLLVCTVDFRGTIEEKTEGVRAFHFRQHVETVDALLEAKIVEHKNTELPCPSRNSRSPSATRLS